MATEDGNVNPQGETVGGQARAPKPSPGIDAEPDLLPADWPGPVTWGAPIGAGGEVLADASDLVPLASSAQPEETLAPDRPGPRPRRPSVGRATQSQAEGGDFPRPRPSIRVPSVGVLAATAAIAGLMGLAGVFLLVLFSTGGGVPSPAHDNRAATTLAVPHKLLNLPDLATVYTAPGTGREEATHGRRRDQARQLREPARRRTQGLKSVPPASAGGTTTHVASPPPATHSAPAPDTAVPPAVREFTPGPWNLS